VINTNLPRILHRFQLLPIIGQIFASDEGCVLYFSDEGWVL